MDFPQLIVIISNFENPNSEWNDFITHLFKLYKGQCTEDISRSLYNIDKFREWLLTPSDSQEQAIMLENLITMKGNLYIKWQISIIRRNGLMINVDPHYADKFDQGIVAEGLEIDNLGDDNRGFKLGLKERYENFRVI